MDFRIFNLMVHNSTAQSDELILNPDSFPEIKPGHMIHLYNYENPSISVILRVPYLNQLPTGRLEISLSKSIAESVGLKQFSRVVVQQISDDEAKLDFVELSFRKQYLQRGNMLRFKESMIGRTVYQSQNLIINMMQAQIQDIRKSSKSISSGLITNETKFVFRSKSARIVWLVQISVEMYDTDAVS
jgi:DEP domain-containing protein 5